LIIDSEIPDSEIDHYYPQCLRCTIQTFIQPENLQLEENNQCLLIDLQCIQIIFNTTEMFEDFFQFSQPLLSALFYQENGTDQNTLHVIMKENSLKEINADYIERIFQRQFQAYRALFLELYIPKQTIRINRNLIAITRLSMKLILVCEDDDQKRKQTIYIVHNQNITLESKQDFCSTTWVPSSITITSTSTSNEVLSISHEKSKNIVLIIFLLTGFLLSLLTSLIIYCFKRLKHRYRRLSKKIETPSEFSISPYETPLTPLTPKLSLKLKRPLRGMRAIQLLDDDV
jgi:hypothetical protein